MLWKNGRLPPFDDARKRVFLKHFKETMGLALAAEESGVRVRQVKQALEDDPEFAECLEELKQQHLDSVDQEVHRRGFKGIPACEFYKGKWIESDTVRKYSDQLAALYAKRVNPAYRESVKIDGLEQSGVLVVPGTMADPQAWAKMFEKPPEESDGPEENAEDPADAGRD